MKYILTAKQRKATHSSCYFEFQTGRHRGKHWLDDSLCLSDTVMEETELYRLLNESLDCFAYFGLTAVDRPQWQHMTAAAAQEPVWTALVSELTPWAEQSLQRHGCFTICGI